MSYQQTRPQRSGTTTAVAVIHFVGVGLSMLVGVLLVLAGIVGSSSSSSLGRGLAGIAAVVGIVVLLIAGFMLFVGVQFLQCRPWARWVLVTLYALGTLSALGRLSNGGANVLGLGVDITMLVLLFLPSTAEDFKPRPAWSTAYTAPVPYASVPPWQAPGYVPLPQATPPTTPAGWYPDPRGGPGLRYWSGQAWTEHTQPSAAPGAR